MDIVDENEFIFKKCSSYLKRVIKSITEKNADIQIPLLSSFVYEVFKITYRFWLNQPEPAGWFAVGDRETEESVNAYKQLIQPLSHENLSMLIEKLEAINPNARKESKDTIKSYLDMPDYFQILNGYLLAADQLGKSQAHLGRQNLVKLRFLFNIMDIPNLADIHASALREINHSLKMVFQEEEKENLNDIVRNIFGFLKKNKSQYEFSVAIFDCITTTAKEVFAQNSHPLADTFINELIAYGFQYPEIKGSTEEWQVKANPAHIINIRTWLEIIGMKPRWTKRLISALIINLKMGGIFVRDTDLIQKDISALLNTDIARRTI